MSVVEKATNAIDFLKNTENANRVHELQTYAGILGQCMGAIGGHPSMVEQFSMLLQHAIPTLLTLCSHDSAEVRLVGDEALNRVVVGGMPFHASKVHLHLHNSMSLNKNPRWQRAVISRLCLGSGWLRCGPGRGRLLASGALPRLKEAAARAEPLVMECLEANQPRIVKALSPYATRDELSALLTSYMDHINSSNAPIRRNAANCIADLCRYHQKKFITHVISTVLDVLLSESPAQNSVIGSFGVLRSVFTTNPVSGLPLEVLSVEKCMQVYQVCLSYIESTTNDHNVHNAAMECLNSLLSEPSVALRVALRNPHGPPSSMMTTNQHKTNMKGHGRSYSTISMAQSIMSTASSTANLSEDIILNDQSESFLFHGALLLGSMSQHQTPHRSLEDLSVKGFNTPDSPCESMMSEINSEIISSEQLASYMNEKLELKCEEKASEEDLAQSVMEESVREDENAFKFKLNIGSFYDKDVPLKYCARLLASRFLLTGYSGQMISDRVARVSVKACAISCLSSVVNMYPEALTMFLDKEGDTPNHNISGQSEFGTSNNEQLNDFVLERNICYQESLTDSFGQELLSKSIDIMSQSGCSNNQSMASQKLSSSGASKRDKYKNAADSMESSLAGVQSNILDSRVHNSTHNVQNPMGASVESANLLMTESNMTMGSNMTASNDPLSTDFLMTTSVDPLTNSLDLEMKFDHFGESTTSLESSTKYTTEKKSNFEQKLQDMFSRNDGRYERQVSNDSKGSNSSRKSDEFDDLKVSHKDAMLRKHSSERSANNPILQTVEENSNSDEVFSEHSDNILPAENQMKTNSSIELTEKDTSEFIPQHISEVVFLLEAHSDPQIRGLIRVCVGIYLHSALDGCHGDYNKWKPFCGMPKVFGDKMALDNLVAVIVKGLSDEIHSCVNNSLSAVTRCVNAVCVSSHNYVISSILNGLRCIECNPYWLCKVNLCKFYEKMPCQRLEIILSDWRNRSRLILNIVIKLLEDQDHRVRKSATQAILKFPKILFSNPKLDINGLITDLAKTQTDYLLFNGSRSDIVLLADYKNTIIISELPGSMKDLVDDKNSEDDDNSREAILTHNLKKIVAKLSFKLMETNCKYFTQGCIETLAELSVHYPPTKYSDAYRNLGLLEFSLQLLEYKTLPASSCEALLAFATQIYAVEAWDVIKSCPDYDKSGSLQSLDKADNHRQEVNAIKSWLHLGEGAFSSRAETLLRITLKMMNIFVHVIEDVVPIIFQKSTSLIPASPIRRKTSDAAQKRNSHPSSTGDIPLPDDKNTLRKRIPYNSMTGQFIPVGYCANESVFMKLFGSLRAAYSSHKVSLDTKSSVFLKFVSTTLDSLSVQLEVMTEKEAGKVAEEVLYYLKCILPLNPSNAVCCVTQMLKCLSSINVPGYKNDLKMFFTKRDAVLDPLKEWEKKAFRKVDDSVSFYNDVVMVNNGDNTTNFDSMKDFEQRRGSNASKFSVNLSNRLQNEKDCYVNVKKFAKCKIDKKWSANKQELARYLRLVEPVVIQALKSYTTQNNITLQCKVLELLNQLLALRVNYCLLDSDQVFIGFVLKQLENIEQHEILDCEELVRCIFTFLVHLSTAKHHTKQLMDIPKLIQLCDGLMASGVVSCCVESLHPVAYRVFVSNSSTNSQEAQVTKEVLFAMLQKMMHHVKVIKLVSSILIFTEDNPEGLFRWSQLACDMLLQLMKQRALPTEDPQTLQEVERLLDCVHGEVLFEHGRIETVMKIMLDKPPDQEYASKETKERWLSTILIFLRKVISNYAENEILLSLNFLKTAHVSPAAIFFNMQSDIDPLNVQSFNENCANLSPDVIFVRFLFRVITYALVELEDCDRGNFKELETSNRNAISEPSYWSTLTISLICQVKHILYLKDGCRFPLLAKTAQNVLQNEQSGLNTGLYTPEENIPLEKLSKICTKLSWKQPLLAMHWGHLLLRLHFLEQKYWNVLFGFLQNGSAHTEINAQRNVPSEVLQIGSFLAMCEHFVDNGLDEVMYLTWLLVNRIHILVRFYSERIVKELVDRVNENQSASGLLLQAIAARCQTHIKGTFGIKVFKILSDCHPSQSGSLLLFICRVIGCLGPSNSSLFAKLGVERCRHLLSLGSEEVNEQLPREDLQIALEMLKKDQIHLRHARFVEEVNVVASTFYDLSPLDLSQDRPINPHYIKTTSVDAAWFVKQVKNRCYQTSNELPVFGRYSSLARLLMPLSSEQLDLIVNCPEFDKQILRQTLILGTDSYIKEFVKELTEWEAGEVEKRNERIKLLMVNCEKNAAKEAASSDMNILNMANNFVRFKKADATSQFFVPIKSGDDLKNESNSVNSSPSKFGKLNFEAGSEKSDMVLPELNNLLSASLKVLERSVQSLVALFPRQSRPLSQFDTGNIIIDNLTMDKYTRRCFQVFRDKLFHQELICVQSLITSYLQCIKNIRKMLKNNIDCEIVDKVINLFIPKSFSKSLTSFTVITLQYTSYLIQLNEARDSFDDGSFRGLGIKSCEQSIDHTLDICITNASSLFSLAPVWKELNIESNISRVQSAINCLYTYVRYTVKDTLPISLGNLVCGESSASKDHTELSLTCDRFLTLIEYWEKNVYNVLHTKLNNVMSHTMQNAVEKLLVQLCRCDFASLFTLIPPLAWGGLDIFEDVTKPTISDLQNESDAQSNILSVKNIPDRRLKKRIVIPINCLQDMDVLEQFLFRVNLIGWTNKNAFEEIWMSLLSALQGNGTHWAVRGMMQLLLTTQSNQCARGNTKTNNSMQKLKSVAIDCEIYDKVFSDVNLESVPFLKCQQHCSRISVAYLKHASGLNDICDVKVQAALKSANRSLQSSAVDVNSCLQLLMDIATQMSLPQSGWGLGARNALVRCLVYVSDIFSSVGQWNWLWERLATIQATTDPADVLAHQYITLGVAKVTCVLDMDNQDVNSILSALSSAYAPMRCAAIHSAIMHLSGSKDAEYGLGKEPAVITSKQNFNNHLANCLQGVILPNLTPKSRISFYEQSLNWSALFILIEIGNTELLKIAINFVLTNPNHICSGLILRGICRVTLEDRFSTGNEVKTLVLKAMNAHPERLYRLLPLLFIQLFKDYKLTSSDGQPLSAALEPEQLLSHLQTAASLQGAILKSPLSEAILLSRGLATLLAAFLPPAAVLNKATQEFIDCCALATPYKSSKMARGVNLMPLYAEMMAGIVNKVFETSIEQDQLPILSGWLFDVLEHLLQGKITANLTPFCLLCLITCSSGNSNIRQMSPLAFYTLKTGFANFASAKDRNSYQSNCSVLVKNDVKKQRPYLRFADYRLLCLSALHSQFTSGQLEKLRSMCAGYEPMEELLSCLQS